MGLLTYKKPHPKVLARITTSCLVHLSHCRKRPSSVNRDDEARANLEAVCWNRCLSACLICQDYMPICQNPLLQLGSTMLLHLTFLESNQEPIAHRQEMLFSQGISLVLIELIVWMSNHRGTWERGSKIWPLHRLSASQVDSLGKWGPLLSLASFSALGTYMLQRSPNIFIITWLTSHYQPFYFFYTAWEFFELLWAII